MMIMKRVKGIISFSITIIVFSICMIQTEPADDNDSIPALDRNSIVICNTQEDSQEEADTEPHDVVAYLSQVTLTDCPNIDY